MNETKSGMNGGCEEDMLMHVAVLLLCCTSKFFEFKKGEGI